MLFDPIYLEWYQHGFSGDERPNSEMVKTRYAYAGFRDGHNDHNELLIMQAYHSNTEHCWSILRQKSRHWFVEPMCLHNIQAISLYDWCIDNISGDWMMKLPNTMCESAFFFEREDDHTLFVLRI